MFRSGRDPPDRARGRVGLDSRVDREALGWETAVAPSACGDGIRTSSSYPVAFHSDAGTRGTEARISLARKCVKATAMEMETDEKAAQRAASRQTRIAPEA